MFNAARGMDILIGLAWCVGISFVFFDLGMLPYLFGDCGRVFANNSSNGSKRVTVI
jgi:hypothetical protein